MGSLTVSVFSSSPLALIWLVNECWKSVNIWLRVWKLVAYLMDHPTGLTRKQPAVQGSYRSSVVKFSDLSLTFQVMEWQFSWPYQNNNPIAQMLEMVHYILRFIIIMKLVIYRAILSAARRPGEHCKLPRRGLGRSPSRNQIWCILAWKSDIWWHQFFIFPDFSKKYFPLTIQIPWLFLVFPDL